MRLLFSPQPSPSRRRVTREALSAGQINGFRGIGRQGLRRAARRKTTPAPGCPAGEGKAVWTLREIAACLCDSVRTGDASCAWPTVSRSSERRGRSLAERKKVSHYSGTQAGAARDSGMHLRWSGPSGCASEVGIKGPICWRPLAGGPTYPKAFLIGNSLQ